MTDELKSRSQMRRIATTNPDALIQEIEKLRTRNAELHRELQAAEAFVVDGAEKLNARIRELEGENARVRCLFGFREDTEKRIDILLDANRKMGQEITRLNAHIVERSALSVGEGK